MKSSNRSFRIFFLLILVLLGMQLAAAISAAPAHATGDRSAAQVPAAPQKAQQAQKPTAPAKPQAEPASSAQGAVDQQPTDPQVAEQLNNIRRSLEQQALERMSNAGSPSYDFGRFMNDIAPMIVFIVFALVTLWILRVVLENRRWNKMVKVQTETHAKLLDRFGSSQEMLAYMASDAGKKFLESPVFEGQRRQLSTLPFGRILWSVQIGIIAAFFGSGLLLLRGRVSPDADMGFRIFGILILTLGIGFLVSGGVSYVLAKYFGLLERPDALARSERNA
ncbi:MAG TPA: hypothetical protein VLY23_01665 [Candidatus Acidoferrum sp.]|nr:hypothetical protein [Candidatus Acidoferrum sp.]